MVEHPDLALDLGLGDILRGGSVHDVHDHGDLDELVDDLHGLAALDAADRLLLRCESPGPVLGFGLHEQLVNDHVRTRAPCGCRFRTHTYLFSLRGLRWLLL